MDQVTKEQWKHIMSTTLHLTRKWVVLSSFLILGMVYGPTLVLKAVPSRAFFDPRTLTVDYSTHSLEFTRRTRLSRVIDNLKVTVIPTGELQLPGEVRGSNQNCSSTRSRSFQAEVIGDHDSVFGPEVGQSLDPQADVLTIPNSWIMDCLLDTPVAVWENGDFAVYDVTYQVSAHFQDTRWLWWLGTIHLPNRVTFNPQLPAPTILSLDERSPSIRSLRKKLLEQESQLELLQQQMALPPSN